MMQMSCGLHCKGGGGGIELEFGPTLFKEGVH